jgi:PST family polysaccharide transporter
MILGVAGLVVLTRSIGAAAYGLYAAAVGVNLYAFLVTQWGIPVYLVRKPGGLGEDVCDQAFTLLMLGGLLAVCAMLLGLGLLERWVRIDGFAVVEAVLLLALPVQLATVVPLARLERDLLFGRIAVVELSGQLCFYATALPLAFMDAGVWAPVVGWWSQQLLVLVCFYWLTGYRPRVRLRANTVKPMLGYGLSFSTSIWVWQLRTLVNPLLISRYLGAEIVGFIALANRIAVSLGFVKTVMWRLSLSAFSRIQDDAPRLCRAVSEGMLVQVLTVGSPLLAFTLAGPWIVDLVYDASWLAVLGVYPFIAAGLLVNALFNLHSSALYVLRRNWDVTLFHVIHVLLLAAGVIAFAPSVGIVAYGIGEMMALASYVVIHASFVRVIGRPSFAIPLAVAAVMCLALFWQSLGWPVALGLVWLIAWPRLWRKAFDYLRELRLAVHA